MSKFNREHCAILAALNQMKHIETATIYKFGIRNKDVKYSNACMYILFERNWACTNSIDYLRHEEMSLRDCKFLSRLLIKEYYWKTQVTFDKQYISQPYITDVYNIT